MRLPREQVDIRAKCFHPSAKFSEFPCEDAAVSIPERFDHVVQQFPDKMAVKMGNVSWTYTELQRAANRLSQRILSALEIQPEPVAFLLDQSVSLIGTLLGILKAGKFYVPLDPSYPLRRNKAILEDSGTRLIVTDRRNLSLAQQLSNGACRVLDVDAVEPNYEEKTLPNLVSPDDLAWLLYTSGTTGEPKGVIQNHRNVLHFIRTYSNAIHVSSEDRMSLLRYASIFGGTRDILAAILNGAGLCLFDVRKEGVAALAHWLVEERITVGFFGAPLFRSFLDAIGDRDTFPELRLIRLGSDTIKKTDIDRFQDRFSSDCVLVNGLSSTETATICKYFITKQSKIATATVPIGYPVEDTEILLLDDEGQEVGPGQIGNIAVKSRYLALGYWRQPELTRAVFLDQAEGDGMRVFRSGDLGRRSPDGLLEHLGRKDFQVKIRGFRIESTEVERVLLDLADVKDAAVVARNDSTGEARLVAFIVPAVHPGPTIDELQAALRDLIPEYMIPSALVMIDKLPLTPNGKVDRRSLPAPEQRRPGLKEPYATPRTPTEELLATLWAEILGLDKVGIHDNFFALGGHSLLATRVISRARKSFQRDIRLRALFEHPTVADFAAHVAQSAAKTVTTEEMEDLIAELESLTEEEAQRHVSEAHKNQ
jgi:amino acid adenylation domain-containing protein